MNDMDKSGNNLETKLPEKEQFASKIEFRHDVELILRKAWKFLVEIFSITEDANIEGTIEGIKRDMVFRGHSAWILIASIFIASIGLNTNSTAVIIGAMLISPLMGPILGIGLAVGTNDWETLTRALKNFGTAIIISLAVSAFYFWISPLDDVQSEMLSRTKPTLLDVLIALFGGLAGIIAGSRREKTNVIPGVAIATALMPPLCTAGYGLGTGNMSFFFGAFYLFFLNSVFISIATFIMVRYLKFPVKNILDPIKERKLKMYMGIFILVVILPSGKLFYDVIRESRFNASADQFVKENVNFKGSEIINVKKSFSPDTSTIDIYVIGKEINDSIIFRINKNAKEYGLIANNNWFSRLFSVTDSTIIEMHQAKDNSEALSHRLDNLSSNLTKELRVGILEDLYSKNETLIINKDRRIAMLESEIIRYRMDSLPLTSLRKELAIQYENIDKFVLARGYESKTDSEIDTIPYVLVKWKSNVKPVDKEKQQISLQKWLQIRLNLDTISVVPYY